MWDNVLNKYWSGVFGWQNPQKISFDPLKPGALPKFTPMTSRSSFQATFENLSGFSKEDLPVSKGSWCIIEIQSIVSFSFGSLDGDAKVLWSANTFKWIMIKMVDKNILRLQNNQNNPLLIKYCTHHFILFYFIFVM